MVFLVPSIQFFFFGLPRALLCFGIHYNIHKIRTGYTKKYTEELTISKFPL